ncbi:MAG: ATP-dependent RecD-like DNA helicase [Christensenellaceae bacterium]|jgi:exodeoxyribonuclease V alpha subunit|nr:ATP-dependent RecD-like DNA helicase [Christensenellaceae bacterium]
MQLCGTVKTIIFRSEDTGFTVLELQDANGEEITAVGEMPLANVGERIELEGGWTQHRNYGTQFKAEACKMLAPSSLSALRNYLASGLIKGVGESTAEAIVNTFGMDTLTVLDAQAERLTEVPGIGRVRAHTIAASFAEHKGMRDIMLALQGYGITIGQAGKLYKIYGELCLARIQENPYQLIDDVEGIGFKTADAIAQNAGIAADSAYRMKAGLKYALQWARQEGHTYLPRQKLLEVACGLLGAELRPAETALDDLIIAGELVYQIVGSEDGVFLPALFRMEQTCATRLLRLGEPPVSNPFLDTATQIHMLEDQLGVSLALQQRRAVELALKSGTLIITGGPGTGKTTILRFIITLIEKLGLEYELCAPTGRAAKRMGEATEREARTIHRLLEYGYGEMAGFSRDEDNTIDADVVIVDEMSMVDVPLLHSLLRAIRAGTRLIMVGDSDQLPPVGAGNALRDMIQSGLVAVVRLEEVFRQSGRSAIVTNAHRINSGQPPLLTGFDDFGFEPIEEAESILRRVIGLCGGKTGVLGTQEPLKDVQVLAPMKKGTLGVHNINRRMQAALNPPQPKKHERKYGETIFREGDKVMQIKNDYRLMWQRSRPNLPTEVGEGVYNGDMGTILRIDLYEQTVEVLFDDARCTLYEFNMLEELELAYCISIHKSQGSEFPIVLLPLAGGPPMLMTRNLLYTAVTRARKQVYIIGHADCPARMVQNAQVRRRYSALASMLQAQKELLPC